MTVRSAGVPPAIRSVPLPALLLAAALVAGFVNAGIFTGRAVMRARSDHRGARERTAEGLARSLQGTQGPVHLVVPDPMPASMRLQSLAFELRLRYACYPRSIQVIRIPTASYPPLSKSGGHPMWGVGLPHEPAAVVTYGTEMVAPPGWTQRRFPEGVIALRGDGPSGGARAQREPQGVRLGWLIVGVGALYALGACICSVCGVTGLPWPARVGLWHLTGATLMAVTVTVGLAADGRLTIWPTYAALGLAATAAWCRRGRDGHDERGAGSASLLARWAGMAAWALLGLGIVGIVVTCMGTGLAWDGWTIWQIKARAFFHDGNLRFLGDAAHDFAHRDYPLLVPLHTWWVYAHAGTDYDKLGQVAGLLFAADLLALTYGLMRMWACRWTAVAATALIAAQPTVIRHASSGYADVALAAFLVAVAALFSLRSSTPAVRHAVLSGLVAAGCALTKNEGLGAVVAVGALMAYRVGAARSRASDFRGQIRAAVVALAVAPACISPWWLLKDRLDLRSDMFGGTKYPVVEAALGSDRSHESRPAASRVPEIAGAAGRSLLSIGPRYPAWGLVWLIALAGAVVSVIRRSRGTGALLVVLAVQAVAYLMAYLQTPHSLAWHLATSLDRLMMHLMPPALIAGMIALARASGSETGRMLDERGLQPEPPA